MYYFITDALGKDWRGRQWGEGITFSEENPNYHFVYYDSPLVALFMNPASEEYKNPRLWLAEVAGEEFKYDFRRMTSSLKVVREVEVPEITLEQRLTFGIVCALNVVTNKVFNDWGLAWLKGRDRSVERARKLADELLEQMLLDFVAPAHAACASVVGEGELYSACAAHRAYHDSLGDFENPQEPIDLAQIATIVTMLPASEIGAMLSGEENNEQGTDDPGPHPGSEGVGLQQASVPDGEQAGPTEDVDQGGPEDVRHGGILPGSQEEAVTILTE